MFFAGLSWEEGKKKWRDLSRQYHPDLASDEADRQARTTKFQKLSAEWHVWEWLHDPRTEPERREHPARVLKKEMEYLKLQQEDTQQYAYNAGSDNPRWQGDPFSYTNQHSTAWNAYWDTMRGGGFGFHAEWRRSYEAEYQEPVRPPADWQPTEEEIEQVKYDLSDIVWEDIITHRERPLQFVYDKDLRRLWIHGRTYPIKDKLRNRGVQWDVAHYCNYYQFEYKGARQNG